MRAYYYFHLLRTYGGVPLRLEPEVPNGITDPVALRKARATEAEVLAAVKVTLIKLLLHLEPLLLPTKPNGIPWRL